MEHSVMCKKVNAEMWDALSTVPHEDRSPGDDTYRCNCGLERIAQEHAEMKAAMEKVAAMRSNSGSFLAAQEIIVDALNKINAKETT